MPDQVLLAALPAECGGHQDLVNVSGLGNHGLVSARDVAIQFRFKAQVNVVSLGQELVEPECEYRTLGPRVQHVRTGSQRRLDRCGACVWRLTSEFGKSPRGLWDGGRAGWAHQTSIARSADNSELRLDPRGKRIGR